MVLQREDDGLGPQTTSLPLLLLHERISALEILLDERVA